jgi:N-ethylmaleimide reductase
MAALFDSHEPGGQRLLNNRIVMAPMTRTRTSEGDVPNAPVRVSLSPRQPMYLRAARVTHGPPGIYTDAQVEGWKL